MLQGPVHPATMHLFEVIAAPTKAHITDIQRARHDFNPNKPYLQLLSIVTPMAHKGAIIQNIIN